MMERREFLAGSLALPSLLLGGAGVATRWAPRDENTTRADERFEKLAQLVTEKMAEYHVPGVAFGVVKDGQTLVRGFGITSVEDPQPITPDTIFQIASVSKLITATAVMRLVEQGRVDLRAPVQRYLPDFRVRDEQVSRNVTLWHLMTHTSGLENKLFTEDRGSDTLVHYTQSVSDVDQLAPLGAVWSYNSAGFVLAGRVIEVITGMGIHDALRNLVFAPLGLSRASTRLDEVVTYRVALGHRSTGAGATEVVRPFWMGSSVPGGGVAISLANLLSFAAFHLGTGDRTGEPLLSIATRRTMLAPQLRKHATEDDMGIGWHLRTLNGVVTAAHGGSGTSQRALVQLVPARDMGFAILANHTAGHRLIQDVERATLQVYEGLSLRPNQAIAHRGVTELMTGHASPLSTQPNSAAYIGSYKPNSFGLDQFGRVQRTPVSLLVVREEGRALVVSGGGTATAPVRTAITFYGPDVAYSTSGASSGTPYEFVRSGNGNVGWIRVNGQIARRVDR
jgi:CubicO group peptidase (beta-lactamase class C family)